MPGDIVFALAALMMSWDFIIKVRPMLPQLLGGAKAAPGLKGEVPVAARTIPGPAE